MGTLLLVFGGLAVFGLLALSLELIIGATMK